MKFINYKPKVKEGYFVESDVNVEDWEKYWNEQVKINEANTTFSKKVYHAFVKLFGGIHYNGGTVVNYYGIIPNWIRNNLYNIKNKTIITGYRILIFFLKLKIRITGKKWIRYRFNTKSKGDYRPIIFNPKFPWYCTGESHEYVTIVCWLPVMKNLYKYWPLPYDVEQQYYSEIFFTDRFPKQEYYKE